LGKENKGETAFEERQQYPSTRSLSLSPAYTKTTSLLAQRQGSVQDTALSLRALKGFSSHFAMSVDCVTPALTATLCGGI